MSARVSSIRRLSAKPHLMGAAGALLLALAVSPPARAVTYFSVDGQSPPYAFSQGETYTLRVDVGKAGGADNFRFARDLTGSGKYDPTAPLVSSASFTDGSGQDTDPTPGKLAVPFKVAPTGAAGPYVLDLEDVTDKTTLIVPGFTFAPKPAPQAISGHVAAWLQSRIPSFRSDMGGPPVIFDSKTRV